MESCILKVVSVAGMKQAIKQLIATYELQHMVFLYSPGDIPIEFVLEVKLLSINIVERCQ